MKSYIYSVEKIKNASKWVLNQINHKVVVLEGQMGSGKTTLIKSICECLGVIDQISSPTFSLINEYSLNESPIYHFDCYRLKNIDEAYDFGAEEYIDSGSFCFIEWPEKIDKMLPLHYHEISISIISSDTRKITFK